MKNYVQMKISMGLFGLALAGLTFLIFSYAIGSDGVWTNGIVIGCIITAVWLSNFPIILYYYLTQVQHSNLEWNSTLVTLFTLKLVISMLISPVKGIYIYFKDFAYIKFHSILVGDPVEEEE